MMILKQINALSLAKIYGALMAFTGLIFGVFLAIINLSLPQATQQMMFYSFFGFWGIIILPIFYGIMGFIAGLLTAGVYNLVSKYVGGLEVELEKK
jgi:hypothetical protein